MSLSSLISVCVNVGLPVCAVVAIVAAVYDFMDHSHSKKYRYQQSIISIILALGIFLIAIFNSVAIDCCGMIIVIGAGLLHIHIQKRYVAKMIHDYTGNAQ